MSIRNRKQYSEDEIRIAISEGRTMGGAAKVLNLDWRTFKKQAEQYGLYERTNSHSTKKLELSDILAGKHPQYNTSHITPRLIKEGYKKYLCEGCGISEWMGARIGLELDHIDGDNSNHVLENLRLLCPNCHSQTETYRSKKLKFNREKMEGQADR